jgi:hypothetical protein
MLEPSIVKIQQETHEGVCVMAYGMVWGLLHGWWHSHERLCMIVILMSTFV